LNLALPKGLLNLDVVTGGAGFIGTHLVRALVSKGRTVVVVDPASGWQLAEFRRRCPSVLAIAPNAINALFEQNHVACVFHLGAISSTRTTDDEVLTRVNVRLPQKLWRFCHERRVPFIWASSAATYGSGASGFDDALDKLPRLVPLNAYGRSKHAFDYWAVDRARDGYCPPSWLGLKFFNCYGSFENHKGPQMSVAAQAFEQIASRGAVTLFQSDLVVPPRRDFVWVGDCVNVMLWAALSGAAGIFNVGTGVARAFEDLANSVICVLSSGRIETIPMPRWLHGRYQYYTCAEIGRLRSAGYRLPFVGIEDGVRLMADQMKADVATSVCVVSS
jgi:ADP-L-glycero-D-manno-heptose 6-epimerase